MNFNIPEEIILVANKLVASGYKAYLVGGCVRDLLMNKEPKDWDITTNAKPQEIQKIFPDSVYENNFGTVAVKTATRGPHGQKADYADAKLLYEDLTYKIRGILFDAKKEVGLGHKENVYQNIIEMKLKKAEINFEREKTIHVIYEDKKVGIYKPDFVIEDKIILEIKSISFIGQIEKQQIISYLRGSDYKVALLVNFGSKDIQIERVVYDFLRNNSPRSLQKSAKSNIDIVEITTFRQEGKYTDKRHPDEIKFAKTVEEDLARRDFTINAIAAKLPIINYQLLITDPFNGQKDIKNKIIRTVGNPEERFNEDALRLMRAIRFAVQLGFEIEEKTFKAIKKEAGLIEMIAKERIRDELEKIIMSDNAKKGIELLEETGLLKYIMPEIREGINVGQNKHHIYSVWEHNLRALDYAVKKNYPLEIRMASLLHDVAKPRTKDGDGPDSTFYNHEIVGAKIAAQILDRLHFSKNLAEKIIHLVRYHLFYYNVGEVTESGVRRFLRRVGPENIADLIKVREADRIGSGVPKALPYKLRHLLFMIEKVKRDPISPKMLKTNGNDIMKILKIEPGPKVGQILAILLDEILDEPIKNTRENLELRIKELGKLSDSELEKLSKQAREKKEEFEGGVEEEIKKKYYVK